MKIKHFLAINAGFLLVACGGGGSSSSGAPTLGTSATLASADYSDLQAAGLDVYTNRHAEEATFVSALPKGPMTYTGVAAFTTLVSGTTQAQAPAAITAITNGTTGDVDSSFISGVPGNPATMPDSVALIRVDVDFEDKAALGQITNIQHKDGYQITGKVDIKNGELSGNRMTATFVGNVNEEGDQQIWSGDIDAIFVGSSGQGLYGDFNNATTPAGDLYGGFVAQSE